MAWNPIETLPGDSPVASRSRPGNTDLSQVLSGLDNPLNLWLLSGDSFNQFG